MTEKRYYQMGTFLVEDELFYEDDNRLGFFEDETEENIKRNNHMGTVDRLWELRTLNIHLKRNNKKFRKENEQLKSENNRLVNETARIVAEHQKRVLDLIDEKIKLYSHKPVSAPISQPMSVNFDADMDRLVRLSELKALKEELQE